MSWEVIEYDTPEIPEIDGVDFVLQYASDCLELEVFRVADLRTALFARGGTLPVHPGLNALLAAYYEVVSRRRCADISDWWVELSTWADLPPMDAGRWGAGLLVFGHDGQPLWVVRRR